MSPDRRAYLDSLTPHQRRAEIKRLEASIRKKERKIEGLRFLIDSLDHGTPTFNDLYFTLNILNISI